MLGASASRLVVDKVLGLVGCLTEPGIVCWIVAWRAVRYCRQARNDSTLRGQRRSSGGAEGLVDSEPRAAYFESL